MEFFFLYFYYEIIFLLSRIFIICIIILFFRILIIPFKLNRVLKTVTEHKYIHTYMQLHFLFLLLNND